MLRWLAKIVGLCIFIACGSAGIWYYQDHFSARHEIAKLEQEKQVLTRFVERLSEEKRVAQVLVTNQQTVNGVLHTTLLFVEDDKAGESVADKMPAATRCRPRALRSKGRWPTSTRW